MLDWKPSELRDKVKEVFILKEVLKIFGETKFSFLAVIVYIVQLLACSSLEKKQKIKIKKTSQS